MNQNKKENSNNDSLPKVTIPKERLGFYKKCNLGKYDWEAIKVYYIWKKGKY